MLRSYGQTSSSGVLNQNRSLASSDFPLFYTKAQLGLGFTYIHQYKTCVCLTTIDAPRCQVTMAPSPSPEPISRTDFPAIGRHRLPSVPQTNSAKRIEGLHTAPPVPSTHKKSCRRITSKPKGRSRQKAKSPGSCTLTNTRVLRTYHWSVTHLFFTTLESKRYFHKGTPPRGF